MSEKLLSESLIIKLLSGTNAKKVRRIRKRPMKYRRYLVSNKQTEPNAMGTKAIGMALDPREKDTKPSPRKTNPAKSIDLSALLVFLFT